MDEQNIKQSDSVPLVEIVRHDPRSLQYMSSRGFVVIACRKGSDKERRIPIRSLLLNNPKFFQAKSGYEYFVDPDTAAEIYKMYPKTQSDSRISIDKGSNLKEERPIKRIQNFGSDYEEIIELQPVERINRLREHRDRLASLMVNPAADPETANGFLVDATAQAAMINKATIQEALRMGNSEAKRHSRLLVTATEEMMDATQALLDSDLYKEDLINQMIQQSKGTVVQHMTRVFLMGFSFLIYYNREYSRTSLANRIRARFGTRYRHYYTQLLPHINPDEITLERVFHGGMRSLSSDEIRKFAMGYLIHDIGKLEDIEYHEGEEGYDREKVVRHVKLGYKAVMEKTIYPTEAALITGYHHEYYGDPGGYGYFRELLAKYKEMRPDAQIQNIMSYEMEPLIDYEVLAFFPAKMLEIIDVYDSLTDPNRLYRSPLSARETLKVLREEFVENKLKVDPILLDLFEQFMIERGII
ncbi:HD-GYP domain-containing protein [Spirochaeta dissipatitropha]